jgi:hypothetical protein
VTIIEVVSFLLPLGVIAVVKEAPTFGRGPDRETFGEFFQRVSDELLWPRILVRTSPPQGGVQPNAPVRL